MRTVGRRTFRVNVWMISDYHVLYKLSSEIKLSLKIDYRRYPVMFSLWRCNELRLYLSLPVQPSS
jgi:hypothetical protein